MFNNPFYTMAASDAPESNIMSIDELAEYLRIGKSTAYSLLRSGNIRGFKIGCIWKVSRREVEAYVENMENHYYDGKR